MPRPKKCNRARRANLGFSRHNSRITPTPAPIPVSIEAEETETIEATASGPVDIETGDTEVISTTELETENFAPVIYTRTAASTPIETANIDDQIEALDTHMSDDEFFNLLISVELQNPWSNLALRNTVEGTGSHLRAVYPKNSRTTKYRKRMASVALQKEGKLCKKVDEMFKRQSRLNDVATSSNDIVTSSSDIAELEQTEETEYTIVPHDSDEGASQDNEEESENEEMRQALVKLDDFLSKSKNAASEVGKISAHQHARYAAVYHYFQLRLDDVRKTEASRMVLRGQAGPKTKYAGEIIRDLARTYLLAGFIPAHRQGMHVKRQAILAEEDVKEMCLSHLRLSDPKRRSPQALKMYIESDIFPKLFGTKGTISEETARQYMMFWGFRRGQVGQNVYYDGHERPDVVEYRKIWAKNMMEMKRRMVEWEGEEMEIEIPRSNPQQTRLVLVTHDECCFYSNDAAKEIWSEEGESILRKKGQGGTIMVSDFLCDCHGSLRISAEMAAEQNIPESIREIIKPGKNADGYWKSEDMVKQLKSKAIPIFKALHPGMTGM